MELALKNALRYIPEKWHTALAAKFMEELLIQGRIDAHTHICCGRSREADYVRRRLVYTGQIPVLTKPAADWIDRQTTNHQGVMACQKS